MAKVIKKNTFFKVLSKLIGFWFHNFRIPLSDRLPSSSLWRWNFVDLDDYTLSGQLKNITRRVKVVTRIIRICVKHQICHVMGVDADSLTYFRWFTPIIGPDSFHCYWYTKVWVLGVSFSCDRRPDTLFDWPWPLCNVFNAILWKSSPKTESLTHTRASISRPTCQGIIRIWKKFRKKINTSRVV